MLLWLAPHRRGAAGGADRSRQRRRRRRRLRGAPRNAARRTARRRRHRRQHHRQRRRCGQRRREHTASTARDAVSSSAEPGVVAARRVSQQPRAEQQHQVDAVAGAGAVSGRGACAGSPSVAVALIEPLQRPLRAPRTGFKRPHKSYDPGPGYRQNLSHLRMFVAQGWQRGQALDMPQVEVCFVWANINCVGW